MLPSSIADLATLRALVRNLFISRGGDVKKSVAALRTVVVIYKNDFFQFFFFCC